MSKRRKTRRANGEGTISERSDGRWTAAVSYRGGGRKYLYGATREEVGQKLTDELKRKQEGLPMATTKARVGPFLRDWLESVRPTLRPETFRRYEALVRVHAIPAIGTKRLPSLGPQDIQKLYAKLLALPLSSSSVRQLHVVLRRALDQAVEWGFVPRNVAALVKPPKVSEKEIATLTSSQVRTLLEAATSERLGAFYTVAVLTGARRGELLGLRWANVNLDDGTLTVRGTLHRVNGQFVMTPPKSKSSRRCIPLGETAIEALRRQKAQQGKDRLRAGTKWTGGDDARQWYVFTDAFGSPVGGSTVSRTVLHRILARAGLPKIRLHDLRHTCATILLASGVNPKVTSELLGHARTGITLDLYSHTDEGMRRAATKALEGALGAGS